MDQLDLAAELEYEHRSYHLTRQQQAAPPRPSATDCDDCGEPIPEARRLAVPGVVTCIACQIRREQRSKP
ncbi:TraR/DksA C4-type zinc finger protein [Parachitinimonas caeni]|uniref:TraR/DksA C4-type zinc finger protein n=1 Tax=Parachitinimonas caeni TaxID=3031301 RepID=A0ABT7DWN5_9NEIS|nr:TraR/DksA C4-type zinc finger protein [Parachitinimonas caeni]MDK2124476.1 TraR/DksA C4-type zinc finger protein [Parachitinimonas caeni]